MMGLTPANNPNFKESFGPITGRAPSKHNLPNPNAKHSLFKNNSFLNNTSLFMPNQTENESRGFLNALNQTRMGSFENKGLSCLLMNPRPSFKTLAPSKYFQDSNLYNKDDPAAMTRSKLAIINNESGSAQGFSQVFGKELCLMSRNSLLMKEDSIFKISSGLFKSNDVLEVPDMFRGSSSQAMCNNSFGRFCQKEELHGAGLSEIKEKEEVNIGSGTVEGGDSRECFGCRKKCQKANIGSKANCCKWANNTNNSNNSNNTKTNDNFQNDSDIHMLRLKSRHADKSDVYIVSCCLNPEFVNKVLAKINGFCNQNLSGKFDMQRCDNTPNLQKIATKHTPQISSPHEHLLKTNSKIIDSPGMRYFKQKSLVEIGNNDNFLKSIRKLNEVLINRSPIQHTNTNRQNRVNQNVPSSLINISEDACADNAQSNCKITTRQPSVKKNILFPLDSADFRIANQVTLNHSPGAGRVSSRSIRIQNGVDLMMENVWKSKFTLNSDTSQYKHSQPALLSMEGREEPETRNGLGKRADTDFDTQHNGLNALKRIQKGNEAVKTLNFRLPSFHSQLRHFTDSQLVITSNDRTDPHKNLIFCGELGSIEKSPVPRFKERQKALQPRDENSTPKTSHAATISSNLNTISLHQHNNTRGTTPTAGNFLPESILKNQTKPPASIATHSNKPHTRVKLTPRPAKSKKKVGDNCCKCAKSLCLKLYCQCFANGRGCGPECQCDNCHNTEEFSELRELVVLDTKEKNPEAFNSKYKQRQVGQGEIVHSRGCNCKTGCNKKYCECRSAGTGCSELCKCVGCENHKIAIRKEEVPALFVKVLRKRKRRNILGEYLKAQGKMPYNEFIERTKKQISMQRRRRRKTPQKKAKGKNTPKNVRKREEGLRVREEENVFIESTLMDENGVKVELSSK